MPRGLLGDTGFQLDGLNILEKEADSSADAVFGESAVHFATADCHLRHTPSAGELAAADESWGFVFEWLGSWNELFHWFWTAGCGRHIQNDDNSPTRNPHGPRLG